MSEYKKLRDIAVVAAGQGAPQGENNYTNIGIPFIKAGNLIELLSGKQERDVQKVNEEVARNHKLKLYPAGTILFAKSGMSCMKGYVYRLQNDCYVVSHLACITPYGISGEYLRYYFEYHRPNTLVKDEAYPSISLTDIGNLDIKVVSADEQEKVVDRLSRVCRIIRQRRAQIKKVDDLVKSQFIEMFGDLRKNPKGWNFMPLGKVCDVRDGTHDSPKYCSEGYPLLTSKNFTDGGVDFKGANFISEKDYFAINQRSKVDVGDIVMPMIGTIGHPVIIDTQKPFAIKNVALIKFAKSKFLNVFIRAILDSDYFSAIITSKNRGNTQKFIALGDIRAIEIPQVPYEIQKQFARFIEQTDKSKFRIKQSLEKLETLYKALLQKYFG